MNGLTAPTHSDFSLTFQNHLLELLLYSRGWVSYDLPILSKRVCEAGCESSFAGEEAREWLLAPAGKCLYLAETAGRSRKTLVTATERARTFNASSPTSNAMPGIAR